MFNGGLIGLVSGGVVDVGRYRAEKRERKLERRDPRFERRQGGGGCARMAAYQSSLPRGSLGERGFTAAPDEARFGQEGAGYFDSRDSRRGAQRRDRGAGAARGDGGGVGAVKKVVQEDVLYLMIVPMPSEAELAEAREMLAHERERS